jgi:hypothetical protein
MVGPYIRSFTAFQALLERLKNHYAVASAMAFVYTRHLVYLVYPTNQLIFLMKILCTRPGCVSIFIQADENQYTKYLPVHV